MLNRRKKPPDWGRLHSSLQSTYAAAGAVRMKAVVDNHSDKKESICRRLGVISDADVSRIAGDLRQSKMRDGAR